MAAAEAEAEAEFATNYKEELIDLALGALCVHAPKSICPANASLANGMLWNIVEMRLILEITKL